MLFHAIFFASGVGSFDLTYIICTPVLHHNRFCIYIFFGSVLVICHFDRGGCHAWGRVYLLYLGHLIPLSILEIIHLSISNYYILSIFHYLGSPLSYCTLIVDLMRNFYIYNACIYSFYCALRGFYASVVFRNSDRTI